MRAAETEMPLSSERPACFPRTPRMCSACWSLLVRGGFHDLARPPDHFVQRRPRRHHGINRVLLFHSEIDQYRAIMLPRGPYRGHHLRAFSNRHTANSISLAQLCEVGIEQRCCRVIALVKKLLPLPDHAQESVVDDGDVHLEFLLDNRS